MKEHFQWGDTDGNNGTSFQELTPAELQAAYELQGMPYFNAFGAIPANTGLELSLSHDGQPQTPLIPRRIDAETIKVAIRTRATLLEEQGAVNPPTVETIRQGILGRRKTH